MIADASGQPSAATDCQQSVAILAKILSISAMSIPFVDNNPDEHPSAGRKARSGRHRHGLPPQHASKAIPGQDHQDQGDRD